MKRPGFWHWWWVESGLVPPASILVLSVVISVIGLILATPLWLNVPCSMGASIAVWYLADTWDRR